jgi:hypothetical protein
MELELLFEITATIAPPILIPDTPDGTRVVVHITGGKFEGPRLKGTVLSSGADWFLVRPDGKIGIIDVRLVLKTDDDENIYMTYTGRAKIGPSGPHGLATTPVFATSTKGKYAWLNDVQAFATGEPGPGGVTYKVCIPK